MLSPSIDGEEKETNALFLLGLETRTTAASIYLVSSLFISFSIFSRPNIKKEERGREKIEKEMKREETR